KANLRAVPVTEALQEQRKRSVDSTIRWWLDCLHRGYVFKSALGLEDHWQQWHKFLPTEVLFASYERYAANTANGTAQPSAVWPVDAPTFGGRNHNNPPRGSRTSRVAELIKHPRPPGYRLGALNV